MNDFDGTDHSPRLKAEMEGATIFDAAAGVPCIQHHLSILLTEVNNGDISPGREVPRGFAQEGADTSWSRC